MPTSSRSVSLLNFRQGPGLRPGDTLGEQYRLGKQLGAGGMARVFEGVQLRLNRRVAIKVMSGDLAAGPEHQARFRREIAVTAQLAHPHIVQVLDYGTAGTGEPYLVMEYLEGEDLQRRLSRVRRMALGDVAHIVRQIAAALSAVHEKGVVHRDLKPENVFLIQTAGVRDFVKVFDFGISKVHAAQTQLTRSAVLLGTPEYMAPEQTTGRGEAIDHRTDQWALACVAWCMLTGKPPFPGADVTAILFQAAHQPPPALRNLVPGLPEEVESVLLRALAKSPRKRFPTIAAFARAFEQACGGEVEVAPAKQPRSWARFWEGLLSRRPQHTQRLPAPAPSAARPPAMWLLLGATAGAVGMLAAQTLMR